MAPRVIRISTILKTVILRIQHEPDSKAQSSNQILPCCLPRTTGKDRKLHLAQRSLHRSGDRPVHAGRCGVPQATPAINAFSLARISDELVVLSFSRAYFPHSRNVHLRNVLAHICCRLALASATYGCNRSPPSQFRMRYVRSLFR